MKREIESDVKLSKYLRDAQKKTLRNIRYICLYLPVCDSGTFDGNLNQLNWLSKIFIVSANEMRWNKYENTNSKYRKHYIQLQLQIFTTSQKYKIKFIVYANA